MLDLEKASAGGGGERKWASVLVWLLRDGRIATRSCSALIILSFSFRGWECLCTAIRKPIWCIVSSLIGYYPNHIA